MRILTCIIVSVMIFSILTKALFSECQIVAVSNHSELWWWVYKSWRHDFSKNYTRTLTKVSWLLRSSYLNALLPPALLHISSYPSLTSSLPTTTSPSTPSITFRFRTQPWEPGWPPPTLISSWDLWRRTSWTQKTLNLTLRNVLTRRREYGTYLATARRHRRRLKMQRRDE